MASGTSPTSRTRSTAEDIKPISSVSGDVMAEGYFGKYTGIVKDNGDDEKLGQVMVSVPALFPPAELVVARPALPFGYYFVPEKEAKVWVEFEGGNSDLPLWTGLQYVAGEWPTDGQAN